MSKIEWCDITWNPVWGCKNNCEYCYARKIAKRFASKMIKEIKEDKKFHDFRSTYKDYDSTIKKYQNLKNFKPTWLERNLHKKFTKKSKIIFVNSMSDIEFWKVQWWKKVMKKIEFDYPQHTFIFLTKNHHTYNGGSWLKNCWLGTTITSQEQYKKVNNFYLCNKYVQNNIKIINIEPLNFNIDLNDVYDFDIEQHNIDWIIIGSETGNRKNKIIPELSWIRNIIIFCQIWEIKLFIKDNIYKLYSTLPKIQELPAITKEYLLNDK